MLFWNINIICCIQLDTLKRKPLRVFNNTFWTYYCAIVTINLFLLWKKIYLDLYLFLYADVSKLIFNSSINAERLIWFINILIYSTKMYIKHLLYHWSMLMQSLCINYNKWSYFSRYYMQKGLLYNMEL